MGLSLDSDFQSGNHAMDLQSIVVDLLNFRSGGPELLDETILLFELPEVVPILSPALQLVTL